ncbi:restriction endonuclease subunit S [Halalkalicoccus sp. NIPERK01]|uniref:restriction endonuclease subunit S n=1 Tax=Halalkalicoccus sp. NIPERK01 TaxID=3053469 RepID=UPI00256F2BC4|nr:restriction endonuclease subunit S [Halalkalicoccus sp. NIPERK01]MDL5363923.1 restriction endonuclease subunit S [Halalkalicoccus sp. NIPERK01]
MVEQANIRQFTDEGESSSGQETVRLKHLARINPAKSEISDLNPETDVSFVPLEDFSTDGEIKNTETRPLEEVYDGYTYFREGDIAIAKITPSFENGKGAICQGLENDIGFGTTELHVLRPRKGVSSKFLWYLLRSEPFKQGGEAAMKGVAGQQRIPSEFLEEFSISIAPKTKRDTIVRNLEEIISYIDDLADRLDRLEKTLSERRNTIIDLGITGKLIQNAVMKDTKVSWIPRLPNNWSSTKLKYIVDEPIAYGIVQPGPDIESGVPYIRVSDLIEGELPEDGYMRTTTEIHEQYSRSVVHPGDLIMSIRATVGKVMQVPDHLEEANLGRGIARIRPDKSVNGDFLYYVLNSSLAHQEFNRLSKGATFSEVTLEMVRNLEIPLPPIEEQRQVVDQIQAGLESGQHLDEKVSECESLIEEKRQALITAAITGQIDVSEVKSEVKTSQI